MVGHTMTNYKEQLHVIGNHGYYKYNIVSNTWICVPGNQGTLPGNQGTLPSNQGTLLTNGGELPRLQFHSTVEYDGVLYLVGGKSQGAHFINQVSFLFHGICNC